MVAAERARSRKDMEEALWLSGGIACASVLPRTTGDVVIDASQRSVYLKAYLASTESELARNAGFQPALEPSVS